MPKHIEILQELPKTAVGKIFKPALRARAIARVLDEALKPLNASIAAVDEDRKRGLVAKVSVGQGASREAIRQCLGEFAVPWDWVEGN